MKYPVNPPEPCDRCGRRASVMNEVGALHWCDGCFNDVLPSNEDVSVLRLGLQFMARDLRAARRDAQKLRGDLLLAEMQIATLRGQVH